MISVLGFLTNSLELKNLDWPGFWAGLECRGAETLRRLQIPGTFFPLVCGIFLISEHNFC